MATQFPQQTTANNAAHLGPARSYAETSAEDRPPRLPDIVTLCAT